MKVRLVFSIIFAIYLIAFTLHATYLGKTVYGDGIYYYSWLTQPILINKYSIGPALFWSPFYLSHPGGVNILHPRGVLPAELFVGFASVFYVIAGLVLLYRLLIQKFSEQICLATILLIAFATNLFFYGSIDPVNSHPLSFFTVVLFLSFLKQKSSFTRGITLGLVGIVRPQDVIVGFLLRRVKLLPLTAGVVLGFLPQLLAWQWAFGNPLALPYLGRGEGFSFPQIFGVLFAPSNGLFLWTPVTLLGVIGLWFYKKSYAIIFLLQLLIVSSWSTWWQGASFSGRMFVGMLPILAFGVAWIISKLKIPPSALYLLVFSLSTVNSMLIFYFLASR